MRKEHFILAFTSIITAGRQWMWSLEKPRLLYYSSCWALVESKRNKVLRFQPVTLSLIVFFVSSVSTWAWGREEWKWPARTVWKWQSRSDPSIRLVRLDYLRLDCRLVIKYVFRFICSTLFGSLLQQVEHEIEP